MNAASWLLAAEETSKTALLFCEANYTYDQLRDSVFRAAHFLCRNHTCGDRILLLADSSFEWVVGYLSTLLTGLICIPISGNINEAELRHILTVTQPARVLTEPKFRHKYAQQLSALTVSESRFWERDSDSIVGPLPETSADDVATLMFTSGSTGTPRGVMVTHRNIIANTQSIIEALRLGREDRIMAVLPFHYCFGASLLHTHLRVGGSIVVERRFMFPELVLRRLQQSECTGFAGVPSHFQILLRRSSLRKMRFPALRYVQQAGGHLAQVFVRDLQEALPGTEIFLMYGQTEATARLTVLSPELIRVKEGSIGRPIPGVTLHVLDEKDRPVADGEIGELVAEGANITKGYWQDAEATARTFRAGRLYTGDLATRDSDGCLYVVDRVKDFIKCGGTRVSSRQIEDTLLECESLLEVAAIAVPDETLGEAVKVFVVPKSEQAEGLQQTVVQFCCDRIPLNLRPKEIAVVTSLPKSSSGKVLKSALRREPIHP